MANETSGTTHRAAGSAQGMTMFGRRYRLGSVLGFEVAIDASWIFIAVLVVWSLAVGFFPAQFPHLDVAVYWAMAVAGALGFFASIVFHELCHSLVARRQGMRMDGITLFIFGGVAQMGDEPPTPRAEFLMAAAGPLASIAAGALFYAASRVSGGQGAPAPITAVLSYLAEINLLLAVFNLVPAFPLDGGRMLRAILWHSRQNLRWATRVASRIGAGFGVALIVLGVFSVVEGAFVQGMWWALIGIFLHSVARTSYRQVLAREALAGEHVGRFMRVDPTTVAPGTTLRSLVEDHFYHDYHKMYPVVDSGRLVGSVTIKQVKAVPREEWDRRTVGELATPATPLNSVQANTDATDALALMRKAGASRVVVRDGDRLAGILTLNDLMHFLAAKLEMESA